MANIKFSQFTNQPAADTSYLVGFDGSTNTNYTKEQLKDWLTTGNHAIPTLYSADGVLTSARAVDLSTFNLTFNGSSAGRIIYSGVGEAAGYVLKSDANGVASWGILSETGGGTNITSYNKGDIIYSDASNSLDTLSIGTVGQVLKVVGTNPNELPQWADETDTTYTGGTDISIDGSNVIAHDAITNTPAATSSTLTAGGTFTSINSVTVSTQGHLTGQTVETYTLPTDTDTTYAVSAVDGDVASEEKIVLTAGGSGTGTSTIVLEAGSDLSISRTASKITFTNDAPNEPTLAAGAIGELQYNNGTGGFVAVSNMTYTTKQLKVLNEVYLDGDGINSGIVKLGCENTGAPHYVGLEGPTHDGANAYIIKFPDATPTASQVLKVNTITGSTANMIWGAAADTNIANTDLTLNASRTLDLGTDQNLAFNGAGTSKITFSNLGGLQIDKDTTFKSNAIVEGQGYTQLTTTTYSSSVELDFNDSNVQTIELTGNITFSAPLNIKPGATYILILKQGGSGGHSVSLHSSMKLPSNATFVPTAAAGKADVLTMIAYSSSVLMTVATLNLATS